MGRLGWRCLNYRRTIRSFLEPEQRFGWAACRGASGVVDQTLIGTHYHLNERPAISGSNVDFPHIIIVRLNSLNLVRFFGS
jgi:hypothetical protein